MTEIVEVRCNVGPRRLFAKFRLEGGVDPHVTDDNLAEFACSDCTKVLRAQGKTVLRVIHQFNFFGELVSSYIE